MALAEHKFTEFINIEDCSEEEALKVGPLLSSIYMSSAKDWEGLNIYNSTSN